jgi:hypothetical protein
VGVFNVNGIPVGAGVKQDFLVHLINECHLCGLNETRCRALDRLLEQVPDYTAFSAAGARPGMVGQGIALLVHDSVRDAVKLWRVSRSIQLMWVRVAGWVFGMQEGDVMLGVVYIPPITGNRGVSDLSSAFCALAVEIEDAKRECPHVFLMGDLNAHVGRESESHNVWTQCAGGFPCVNVQRVCVGCRDTVLNAGGRLMLEMLNSTDLVISTGRGRGDVGQPTCKDATRTEHFVMSVSLFEKLKSVKSYPPPEKDHGALRILFPSPLVADRGCANDAASRHVCDRTCRRDWCLMWKAERQQLYAHTIESSVELSAQFDAAVNEEKIEVAAGLLMSIIQGAATESSVDMIRTLQCEKLRGERNERVRKSVRFPAWFNQECRDAKRELKHALRSGEARHLYQARKREYRHLLRRAERRHTKYQQALFLDRLGRMDADAIKMLRKKTPRKPSIIPAATWHAYIAKHFGAPDPSHTHGAPPPAAAAAIDAAAAAAAAAAAEPAAAEPAFVIPDVAIISQLAEKYARKLKSSTASGFDGLLAPFVKCAVVKFGSRPTDQRHVLAPLLGRLFHLMLRKGVIPSAWKTARLSPIHKKNELGDPNNYRMIAVTGVLYRVYANVMREMLTEWSLSVGAVPDTQFAFYPNRSAQQPMFILRHLIHSTKQRKERLFTTFIDFTQAYDHVDRDRMWEHFRNKLGMPEPLVEAVKALYTDDAYVLVDGSKRTPAIHPQKGVKQGCPLSPLLFSLFISDITTIFNTSEADRVRKGGVKIEMSQSEHALLTHMLYADDLALFATNVAAMNGMLETLRSYAANKGLTVNAAKTQVVIFNSSSRDRPNLMYGTQRLEVKEEFRYLGMVFNRLGNFNKAADAWCGPMLGAIQSIYKAAREVGVHQMPHAMLRLFQTFVVPYGMYASQIWGSNYIHPDTVFKPNIQVRHLGFLKLLAGVKRSVAGDVLLSEMCQIPFQFYWLRSVCHFWNSTTTTNSAVMRSIARADVYLSYSSDKCWSAAVVKAMDAYPQLQGQAIGILSNMNKFDVACVGEAWKECFRRRLQQAGGDPRDPALGPNGQRKLCTYNTYFRQEGKGTWWNLPRHLNAGTALAPDVVRNVARFRLGSHGLGVERGRHTDTPWAERVCRRCAAHGTEHSQVDDERHMVFECISFAEIRSDERFKGLFDDVVTGDLKSFMLNADHIAVAQFIDLCMRTVDSWNGTSENEMRVTITHAEQPRTG